MKKRVIGILTLLIVMSVIFFFETSGSKVFAAEGSVKTGDGFISVEYQDLADFRDGNKKIAPEAPEDYANYIFAGWYKDEDCKQAYSNVAADTTLAYAKFVPESILSVKAQLKADATNTSETTNMRLVSSVDSLRYQNVGFEIYYNGAETPIPINATKVFRRIVASEESGVDYNYSAQVVDKESQYFVTATLLNIKNDNFGKTFYVKPYWTTLDGTTVYGVSKYVTIENGLDKSNVNLTVNVGEGFDANNMQVTIGGKEYPATVAYYDEGKYAHLNVTVQNGDTVLKALNTVSVTDGTITASTEYRNLYAKYSGDETEDTTWYDANADEYLIATSADLYGLASLVNDGNKFSGKTVYLIADIEVNKGRATETGWSTFEEDGTTPIEDATSYMWVPIGADKNVAFAGNFDGQGHTIKGVNASGTTYIGLFGYLDKGSTVTSLELHNSYFSGSDNYVASIAAYAKGNIDTVYSTAYVVNAGAYTGGIVGRIEDPNEKDTNQEALVINNCWFGGSVTSNGTCGGIVSSTGRGDYRITNCLNTGGVTNNKTGNQYLGGILGTDNVEANDGYTNDIEIANCLNVGRVYPTEDKRVGSLVGARNKVTTNYTIRNSYATTESYSVNGTAKLIGTGKTGIVEGSVYGAVAEATVNGHGSYDAIGTLDYATSQNTDGVWVVRETATNVADGSPALRAFVDQWIDVAWYYETDGKTYSISTAEEMYGFSDISQDYDFSGDTIQLANDIEVNSGKASSWVVGSATPGRQWKPIGKDTPFAGTFDGQEKTISGIYVNETTQNAGLFATTKPDVSTIKDIRMENSYIYSTSKYVGSLVGYSNKTKLSNIYSNAYVVNASGEGQENTGVGGLVGYVYNASATQNISNCWFDGIVQGYDSCGGIVGYYNTGTSSIKNSLVTGTVETTRDTQTASTGGVVGGMGNSSGAKLTISLSVHTGNLLENYSGSNANVGGTVGYKRAKATLTFADVHTIYKEGLGHQATSGDGLVKATDTTNIVSDINDIKGSVVYTNGVMNLGYYMYDSTWVARKTDIPVPRCFVGTVVDEKDIVEDTSAHTAWYDTDPDATEFEIKTENDLLGVAVIVNASEGDYASEQFSGQTIKLVKDMDLNKGWSAPKTADEEVKAPANVIWTPIGNSKNFQGTFDGQGHEIKGIYVAGDTNHLGLFGYVNGANAKVMNLRLTNSYVEQTNKKTFVGGVAGYLNKGTISQIYCKAIVKSNGSEFGGIVGRAEGLVEECWFDGEVYANRTDATYVKAAGIVGTSWSNTGSSDTDNPLTIRNCLNTGKVIYNVETTSGSGAGIGGIYGGDREYTDLTVEYCVNTGIIETNQKNGTGSIVGNISKSTKITNSTLEGVTTYSTADIKNCYSATNTITTRTDGRIFGYKNANCTVTQTDNATKDIEAMKGEVVYNAVDDGGLDLNYAIWTARTTDVPVPICFVGKIVAEEDTVKDNSGRLYVDTRWYTQDKNASTYSIETAHELAGLAQLVNEDGVTFNNKTINLVKDIDLNKEWTAPATATATVVEPANTWTPIGVTNNFQGTFDGHGHEIRGVYVTGETTYLGLFGYVNGANATIMDLRLTNSYVEHTGATAFVGGVVGYLNKGTIKQVYSNAIVKSNGIEFGGIVGRAEGLVEGCWFDGEVYANRTDVVYVKAAGIVGTSWSQTGTGKTFTALTIRNCLNTGKVIYNVETAAGTGAGIGGIFGGDKGYTDLTVEYCLNTGIIETNQKNGTGSIVGQTSQNTTIDSVKTYSTADITNCHAVLDSISNRTDGRIFGYKNANCTVTQTDNQTIDEKIIYGLGAQLLTSLDFVQDEKEAIWAARRGQIPVPAGLVADSDKLNIRFGKADTDIADGATGDSAADPYVIENVEELYGFAILSRTDTFADKFIKLSDDIDVLDLNPSESAEDWAKGTVASLPWYSIGTSSKRFAGHFDGNGKTISGIYMNDDSSYLGLFAATETGSTITNLRLTNSYINYTGDDKAYTGSVVGDLRGDMAEVYSDAIVNSNGTQTGGLIGQVNEVSDDEAYAVDITNCWYNGQLTSSKSEAAGLIARAAKGTVNVDNCLNTGVITTTHNNANNIAAGICSRVDGGAVVTITDTISAGKITDANHGKNVKSVVGYIPNGSVAFKDVFATKSAYARAIPSTPNEESYTGTIVRTQEADRLIGYCVEEVVEEGVVRQAKLEFGTNEWTIRTSDVPVPTCFADLVTTVAVSEIDNQVGLEYLNETLGTTLTLADAVDMGEGNYVLKVTVDDTIYEAYKSALEGLGFGSPVVENVADRVHSVSYKKTNPDWVVTLTYVETTDALTISINTNINSLSDKLVSSDDKITYATGDVKMTMLQMYEYVDVLNENGEVIETTPLDGIYADLSSYNILINYYKSYWYGNSFVFQVSEDHFVVCDGGEKEEYDDLINYMKAADGTADDPVYIDAWIISHQHGDHADVLKAVADDPALANGIYVDAFYISEPNAKVLTDNALYDDAEKQYYGMTLFVKNESGEQSRIYRMHTGQRYNFNGLVMDVIQTQDQIPYSAYGDYNATTPDKRDFNTASTVTLFSTATKKVLIGGDANYVNMDYIMKAYDADETDGEKYTPTSLLQKIDVFVAFHHGKNMSMNLNKEDTSFIDYLTYEGHMFDYVLYPCSLIYADNADPAHAFPYAGEVNEKLNQHVKDSNNIKHYGDGNVEITLQGATAE